MSYLKGLITLRTGVAGIALDAENKWLYFAAMNHGGLFRVPVRDLRNPVLAARQLENVVERFADKPLSDGLSTDQHGNIYVTDVENGAVFLTDREGALHTVVKSSRIRWPDGLSFGPDGWLYLADSALPEQILRTSEYINAAGPYFIYRFQPGYAGIPGQ
jgi:sugar lactone lactonase YvrE